MSNYLVKDDALSYEAARIRAKTGGSASITFDGDKGFGDAIDAIPSGGGAQGLVDLTVNYTNSSSKNWTGTIENNAIKNFTTSAGYLPVPLVLKQPIVVKADDVITMSLDNVALPGNLMFADFKMLSIFVSNASGSCKISIADNLTLYSGQDTSKSLTYSGDTVVIWGFGVNSRTAALNIVYADVHIDLNNERLF